MRRYTAHGRLMEDTEPDACCFFVHVEDARKEIAQLRGNLSLAEEGLANYQQELDRLKRTREQERDYADVCYENEQLHSAIYKALDWCYRENIYGHVRNVLEVASSPPPQPGEHTQQK